MKALPDDMHDLQKANAGFRAEAATFGLHYRCGSCAHVVRPAGSCSMGFPNGFLRGAVRAFKEDGNLAFCKYFELGECLDPLEGET